MAEPNQNLARAFTALREHVDAVARVPAFAEIRATRTRRTRRWAAVSATSVVLATVAILLATGLVRTLRPPPVVQPTPSPSNTAQGPSTVWTLLAASPTGSLYTVSVRCLSICETTTPVREYTLWRTDDLGGRWSVVARFTEDAPGMNSPYMMAASDRDLWWFDGFKVSGSHDGGLTWRTWDPGLFMSGAVRGSVVPGGTVWLSLAGRLYTARDGAPPRQVPSRPPGDVDGIVGITVDRAYAQSVAPDGVTTWYRTVDGAAHWAAIPDQCAQVKWATYYTSMTAAPDGSLWSVCSADPVGGSQKVTILVSTDQGATWRRRTDLKTDGYGTLMYPQSAVAAWRTSGVEDISRTDDGEHWTRVAPRPPGPRAFTAIDADTAAYIEAVASGGGVLYVTVDGGRTWTERPFNP